MVFSLYTVYSIPYTFPVYALEDIGSSRISPASPFYFLKTIRENIELKLAFTPNVKLVREMEFATRRLREVKSLVPTTHQELVEPTLERYWYHLQKISDKQGEKDILAIHLETLESVYDQMSHIRARRAIRAAINRLAGRVDVPSQARVPACNFLTKEASGSSLNEVEREILLGRGSSCYFK